MSVHSVRKYKKLATAKGLNRLMTRYYAKGKIVSKLRSVAWVTIGAPVEILTAMGIASAYPENDNTTVKWRL